MRRIRHLLRQATLLVAVATGILTLAVFTGRMTRPRLATEVPYVDPIKAAEAMSLRDVHLAVENPPRNQQPVDHADGPAAPWWPRGESPILATAARRGQLPPVAERVGAEPLVLAGPDGIGNYGGTWNYAAGTTEEYKFISYRLGAATLFRWSPHGYPIVPHIARDWEARDSSREFVIHLRKGMRWSDGHPFTTEDVRYWWEDEIHDPAIYGRVPAYLIHNGKPPTLEIVDGTTFVFRYEDPHTLLPEILASTYSAALADRGMLVPSHYLRKFHPRLGDRALVERMQSAMQMTSPQLLYQRIKEWDNPQCPRLWPWIYRTYRANSPMGFVRNPYYFAVDLEGNQLPYIDRLFMTLKSKDLVALAAANGETDLQFENMQLDNYTLWMANRDRNDYRVLHWYAGNASPYLIYLNLNRHVEPGDEVAAQKRALFNEREFRQAMSLAIDRARISRAEFSGLAPVTQLAPVPESPLYESSLNRAFIEHDPSRANALLDGIGLTQRDAEGFRTFADGTRLQIFLNITDQGFQRISEWVCADWARIGVRVTPRVQDVKFFSAQLLGGMHDMTAWNMNGKMYDLIEPKNFVASAGSYYALKWGNWFQRGGLFGIEPRSPDSGYPPPPGHPMLEAMELTNAARIAPTREEQVELFRDVLKIAAREVWEINVLQTPFTVAVVKDGFRNVPQTLFYNFESFSPFNGAPETFYFDEPYNSPGAIAVLEREVVEATTLPDATSMRSPSEAEAPDRLGGFLCTAFVLAAVLGLVLVGVRHPYVGRRLMIMIPTLIVISICTFVIIQLPQGDFLDSYILELRSRDDGDYQQRIDDLRELFHLNDSMTERYLRWVGLKWFTTFDSADRGLLQGDLGRSMETFDSVNRLVGERVLLTVVVSLATIVFTWALAMPIGIYSAVRQYTFGDYVATLIGFIGMCVPNFLLALLLMFASSHFLGINISGLFSPAYAAQPEWSLDKVIDLLKHVWVPIVVMGVGGTAMMIRVMRANLLDEVNRPYVVTARAKGVRPLKLLLKYPVRLALNPFVSGLGTLFPQLLSGGTIVAFVMSLPLVGPQLLQALMKEDMYLAGSLIMVMSVLGLLGTLVSDLLLLVLDPRIRMEGGGR